MRIGFTSIYAWRPHVEHLHYLATLAREGGHSTSFLSCDGNLDACYTRELRPTRSAALHCALCRLGGIRSYESAGVNSIGQLDDPTLQLPPDAPSWCQSSAATLGRFESADEFACAEFAALSSKLAPATAKACRAALRWIEKERLDAICLFNGRMDATRAVMQAARTARIPFVSLERTWFGDGLHLIPNDNCLGLKEIHRMMRQWSDRPLERRQAERAASLIASRFLRRNGREWRAYNVSARMIEWPHRDAARKVLLVPGSRNEVWGHPDWASVWGDTLTGYDALIEHLQLRPHELVLRCHPNWGERIGTVDGARSEAYFSDWARRRGVHCIASRDPASTLGLIEQSDAVVVSGGSAALEAGAIGRQVIALTPSIYHCAGFQSDADRPETLSSLTLHRDLSQDRAREEKRRTARLTLRFAYTMNFRVAQFVEHVRCITTTRYEYRDGADPQRLPLLLQRGALDADDPLFAEDTAGEDDVLDAIELRRWHDVVDTAPFKTVRAVRPIRRRWMLRPIDRIREALPRGDL